MAQLLRTEPSTFGLVSPSMKLAHPPQIRDECHPVPALSVGYSVGDILTADLGSPITVQQAVIPIHIPLPLRDSKTNYSKTTPPTVACSSTVLKDPKSPDQQRCKVRTNWATFPEKSANQSVVLTRFQVQTGNISMPIARCHAVLGAFSSSCSVHLKDTETDKVIKVGYKVYPSQPTQIFLQGFKGM